MDGWSGPHKLTTTDRVIGHKAPVRSVQGQVRSFSISGRWVAASGVDWLPFPMHRAVPKV